jgi:hypothetical protein
MKNTEVVDILNISLLKVESEGIFLGKVVEGI